MYKSSVSGGVSAEPWGADEFAESAAGEISSWNGTGSEATSEAGSSLEAGSVLRDEFPPEKTENNDESNSGDNPPSTEKRLEPLFPEVSEVFVSLNPPSPPRLEKSPAISAKEEGAPPELPIPENNPGRMSLYA